MSVKVGDRIRDNDPSACGRLFTVVSVPEWGGFIQAIRTTAKSLQTIDKRDVSLPGEPTRRWVVQP